IPETPQNDPIETDPDAMGLFRHYTSLPSFDPDQHITIHHVADAPTFLKEGAAIDAHPLTGFGPQAVENSLRNKQTSSACWAPFLNATVFRLMNWFYQSSKKTLADLDSLVNDVILQPDFAQSDLAGFRASRECQRLEDSGPMSNSELPYSNNDNWQESIVTVPLPLVRTKFRSEDQAPVIEVP
ncbi:hypothetical protein H0H93_002708, partial [Arthromyces matolae]